jgi:small neutral amino acid transporter SnatA (MarC family)
VDVTSIDIQVVADLFLLLLIGIGPKIALVPFLELTEGLDAATKARVMRKMLSTAAKVAVVLIVLGELLRKLLHFSTGALAIAGGIILLVISASMVLRSGESEQGEAQSTAARDPMRMAVYPLAVPYLLNPTGIVVLVIVSSEATSVALLGLSLGLLAVVLLLDVVVFRWANRVGDHLDENRLLVTEKVFGFLLAALAVQLMLNGLNDLGLIQLGAH